MSHGTDHNPSTAMHEPVTTAATGHSHQKRALRNTLCTPRHCALQPAASGCAGVSGITTKIAAAAAKVRHANTTKIPRHDSTDSAAATGSVANSAPTPPATIIHPARDAWRSAE